MKLLIATYSGNERHITIPKIYLELTNDYPTAALLNQMIFWSDKTKRRDGFFYKTYKEWEEETFLSEYQVRRASKKLKELGFLETKLKKANGSPTLHYKLDMDALSESIVEKLKNRNQRNLSIDSEVTKESLTVDDTLDDNSIKDSHDSAKAKYGDDSPYMKLTNRLEKHILSNNPNYKFRHKKQTWADDFRKTVELDGRDMKEVVGVLDWCQQDDFWHKNILSPSKFREQYDKLVMNMPNKNKVNHNFQPSTDEDKYGWQDQIPI